VLRQLGYFLGGAALGCLGIVGLTYLRWGKHGLFGAAVSGLICLPPAALAMMMSLWTIGRPRAEQLTATLAGFFVRVVAAIGLGLAVFYTVPYFQQSGHEYGFWGSLLLVYLFTLGWEVLLIARYRAAVEHPAGAAH
jgi:hypothetical protein